MKLVLFTSVTPFERGGARGIADSTELVARASGHEVDRVDLPYVDRPELALRQLAAYRWIDSSAADRIICFQPPAHVIPHPNKVVWFTEPLTHEGLGESLQAIDTVALAEAQIVYAGSQHVADRLLQLNGIRAEVLHPPVQDPGLRIDEVPIAWRDVIDRLLA